MFEDVDVFGALRAAVLSTDVPALARKMGVSTGVLYGKINPDDEHHKPTLANFIQVIDHTGNTKPLTALCRLFNGAFVPLPDLSHLNDNALLEIVCRINAEGGHVFHTLNESLEKDGISPDESRRIDAEVDHWIAAILELRARTRFMAGRTEA